MQNIFSIIEPDEAARRDFSRTLSARGIMNEAFPNVDTFLKAFSVERCHALMVEVKGAGGSGMGLLNQLHEEQSPVAAIATIATDSPRLVLDAFHVGVFDCVLKPVDPERLCEVVSHAVGEGEMRYQTSLFRERIERALARLSTGEAQVLESILLGQANKQTALDLKIGLRTVEARRARILRKLECDNISQLVKDVVLYRASRPGSGIPRIAKGATS